MRERLLARRRWWLAALAFAGVVGTHALAYRLTIADHATRGEVLHDTGHDIWPSFVAGAALAALVAAVVGSLTGSPRTGAPAVRATAARLAVLQGIGWLAIEGFERASTGHAELSVATAAPVLIGLVVQAVVALGAAVLLALLGAVLEVLGVGSRRPSRRAPRRWITPFRVVFPRTRVAAAAWSPRGPPSL